MPRVIEFGGDPDFTPGDAGCSYTIAYLVFVLICEGCVDVAVACTQGVFNCSSYFSGLGLEGSEADGGDMGAGVEEEGLTGTLLAWGSIEDNVSSM